MTTASKAGRGSQKGRLQRGIGVALWRQIADDIRREIASGITDEAGRLPGELDLAARFGVNRHTVRAAIAALVHEGVLQSEQGRGTYVKGRKRLVYPIAARTRFSAGLEGQAQERRGELVGHAREPAPAEVVAALGLSPDDEVIRLEILGKADGVPVSRVTAWFGAARFPGIVDAYAKTGSITAALANLGVDDYLRASTSVEARHAEEADRRELKLSPGAIVIVTRATNVERSGSPLHYSRTRFPADRVELIIQTAQGD